MDGPGEVTRMRLRTLLLLLLLRALFRFQPQKPVTHSNKAGEIEGEQDPGRQEDSYKVLHPHTMSS